MFALTAQFSLVRRHLRDFEQRFIRIVMNNVRWKILGWSLDDDTTANHRSMNLVLRQSFEQYLELLVTFRKRILATANGTKSIDTDKPPKEKLGLIRKHFTLR